MTNGGLASLTSGLFGFPVRSRLVSRGALRQERLDHTLELHGHRVAVAVAAAARGDLDPAFRDAIFLDVGLLDAVEVDAHSLLEEVAVEVRAARVERKPVGHDDL